MTDPHTRTLKCISPIDGSLYAQRPAATPDDAHAAIDAARRAQAEWAARPLAERIARVRAGVARLGEMNAAIVPELAWMMGRPVRYDGEFKGVNERAGYMAGIAQTALAPIVVEHSDAVERRILREPHGVVFVIAPWNYPYMTAINTLAPALIAGNAVVLKHATQTLLAGERLAQAFATAGLPDGLLSNLFLDHATTESLVARGRFDFINFTGSVSGGRRIEQAAAGTFSGLGLELGGKDPGYVMDDADVADAAATLIDGAMFNSGQSCCGIERIYVIDSLYDRFVKAAVGIVNGYRLGNPLDPETTHGPMANARVADEVRAQVVEAIEAGARPLIDPARFPADDGGTYVAPQILTHVTHRMRVMRDETFGPVVGIMKVHDDAEALALMNDSVFGLTASLWTADPQRAAALGARIRTGTVFMNRADYLDPALCWTGCKHTGRGGALSVIGYHNLTRPKSYHLKKRPRLRPDPSSEVS
jgi:acyl-CoA reductase-like NAD-dependent aldehyde dehydrogenase